MKRRTFLKSATAASTVTLAGCQGGGDDDESDGSDGSDGSGGDDSGLPRLQTDGKWIVDEDGNEVVPRGVNLVEPRFGEQLVDERGASHEESLELALDESAGWYNRVLRVPITDWGYEETGGVEAYCEEYVDHIVERCWEENVYVIVDYHIIEDYDDEEVHENVEEFWDVVAPRYADEPHVLYEFYNEPNNPSEDSLDNWNNWKEVAQPWVDQIREHAPDTPIIVGSPNLTSLTKYAAESPFEGENLIYAGHIYPGEGDSPEDWDPEYGDVADEVPVMITEWGYDALDDVQPGTTEWGRAFREWLDGKENVGWTAWCFDSHWEPTMFDLEFNLMGGQNYHGWFTKEWLFEKRNDRVPEAAQSGEDAEFEGPPENVEPGTPTEVELTENDDGSVTVAWTEPEPGHEETSITQYNVYVDDEIRQQLDMLALANETQEFEAGGRRFETTLEGFLPGEEYQIYVTAVDNLSNESVPSRFLTHHVSGELEIHAEIPKADAAPSIDGEVDDLWEDREFHEFQHVVLGEVESDADLGGGWRAAWDDEALYVLVDVTDDAFSTDAEERYNNDAVEIYVDADNAKAPDYDGENDFQMVFEKDASQVDGTLPQSLDDAEYVQTETDDGWRLEAAFPWSSLGVDARSAGDLIGFDVHVNDDDDGGERDGKLNWFNEEDDSWESPSTFANVELTE